MGDSVLLINNGYPTELYPQYTTYIRSIEKCIIASGLSVDKHVIRYNRRVTTLYKLYKYLIFWSKCLTLRSDCDIIYINHLPYAWPLILNPFIAKKRLIVHWHGNDLICRSRFVRIANRISSRFIRKALNIVPSHYYCRRLKTRFGKNIMRVLVSPSGGVDTLLFSPTKTAGNKLIISYASELNKEKGADTFLYLINNKAEIERVTGRTIEFHYIKYGSELASYLPTLNRFDGSVVKGFDMMPKEDMQTFLNSSNLLVFPSLRESESLGLTALEAMSCGVPVVAHNICAFPEYVIPGVSGELVERFGSETEQNQAFLSAVVKAINNIESYTPRPVVEKDYSQASVISFYRKIFEDL